ncbi:hypothetical protein BsWGS_01297 [Bradybaena similaris]
MSFVSNMKQPHSYVLKQQAMNYYQENKVPVQMETVLNAMFFDQPRDIYGYLVNYFGQFCKPATLCELNAKPVLDSSGLMTLQTDVYCTVNNMKKYISSSILSRANIRLNLEDQEKTEELINSSVNAAITLINSKLKNKFHDLDPTAQNEIDSEIMQVINLQKYPEVKQQSHFPEQLERRMTSSQMERKMTHEEDKLKKNLPKTKNERASIAVAIVPDRPVEMFVKGCEAAAALSQAVCVCAATSRNMPVYRHVANLVQQNESAHDVRIPLPMVTIMESGKAISGKLICVKEFMIVPGIKIPTDKSVEHIQNIFKFVTKHMVTKYGPLGNLVSETGALCPPLENVTQGLEILIEAVKTLGLTIGEDIHLAINCAGHETFDHEKGKYETLAGQFKSPDDMIDFWIDIIQRYPCILAVIDPIRGEDTGQWLDLCEKISPNVLVIGDTFFQRPGIICKMELPVQTSGIVIHVERLNTVSDIISCAEKYQGCSNELVISANQKETNDTFIVDLAVGLGARFLKVGGLCRGERACKLNRLVDIFKEIALPGQTEDNEIKTPRTFDVDDSESSQSCDSVNSSVVADQACSKQVHQATSTQNEEQKIQLKAHIPFTFPLIKNIQNELEIDTMSSEALL